jgi:hypothetical protein
MAWGDNQNNGGGWGGFGGGFPQFGENNLQNGNAFPSFGGNASPPPFTEVGGPASGGMTPPMSGTLPNGNPFPGQGQGVGSGMEQRPWESGTMPNGNPFPGNGPSMAPPAAPASPMGGGPSPFTGGTLPNGNAFPALGGNASPAPFTGASMGQPAGPLAAAQPEMPAQAGGGRPQFPAQMVAAALSRGRG